MKDLKFTFCCIFFLLLCFTAGCSEKDSQTLISIDRESKIPADAIKVTPKTDLAAPKSYSDDYKDPIPLPYPINTKGAEDSAFILPDGNTLYFFFTPDVNVPVEKQILDGVTGIYVSKKIMGEWEKPKRVVLQDFGKIALDGCEFIKGDRMFFCTVREGYSGIHWFSADYVDGKWHDWKSADKELKTAEYQTGEFHISSDGNELYFHVDNKSGGLGGRDIWLSRNVNGIWQEPENVKIVNTQGDEGYPALSSDNKELWIYRDYALWRSKRVNFVWQEPEKMFSPLAGEASIDSEGNVYFTHHFFKDDKMIEADIYFAEKK